MPTAAIMVTFNQKITEPVEGIVHSETDIKAFIEGKAVGNGTLWITESLITWKNVESGDGFEVNYSDLSMHAISRDISSFPHECIFCVVEPSSQSAMNRNDNEYDEVDSTELRFVPDDKDKLEVMYEAIADCQADPEDEMDDYFGEEYYKDVHGLDDIELSEEALCNPENIQRVMKMMSPGDFQEMVENGDEQFDDSIEDR